MKKPRKWFKRIAITAVVLTVLSVIAFLTYFPGQQAPIAFTLATGFGINKLQDRVDAMEDKAIADEAFSDQDKQFLTDLYTCFAKGGGLTFIYRQSGQMMTRYLSRSGEDLPTDSRIFVGSDPVIHQMSRLKESIKAGLRNGSTLKTAYSTDTFNMADPKFPDSITGLYLGTLTASPQRQPNGDIFIQWRADMPWVWPDYESILNQYGRYHARVFPIPNVRSHLQGGDYCLYIDDGLGAHLAKLDLAKSFMVYAEWNEIIEQPHQRPN